MHTGPSTPLLFIGDNPMLSSGLARIGRDLATLASRLPQWRVGFLGRGGTGSRQLPFVLYPFSGEIHQWGEQVLPHVWSDFAGSERGVIFTIWDASRLQWFAQPRFLPEGRVRDFLSANHFDRWGYFPIDSTGPGDRLTTMTREILLGYDRILTYTEWAMGLVKRSIGEGAAERRGIDWLPHGINGHLFKPRERKEARRRMGSGKWHDGDVVVGVIATNQARKDWGLAAQVGALLRKRYGKRLRIWWHIDDLYRFWSVPALLHDFGLTDITQVTTERFSDEEMAWGYSACDVTIHVGSEGFGYPIAESLACGAPAITGDYGGGAELLRDRPDWLIAPLEFRVEPTHWNCMRPLYSAFAWEESVREIIEDPPGAEECRALVEHLDWGGAGGHLWEGRWKKFFEGGLAG